MEAELALPRPDDVPQSHSEQGADNSNNEYPPVIAHLALSLAGLGFFFALGRLGGVFSIRARTSLRLGLLEMAWLNPALRRYPEESSIIGRLVLAYGELEVHVSGCLGAALFDGDIARRTMFRILGESTRISAADALMQRVYEKAGLGGEYGLALGATKKCIGLRNQYAHCQWADHEKGGLFFTELGEPARASKSFDYWWRHVDLPLLKEQEDYFDYAAEGLNFIEHELMLRDGRIRAHAFAAPKAKKPPPPYNPPEKHIPPWLDPEQQQRHKERALAAKPEARSPEEGLAVPAPQKPPEAL